MYKSDIIGCHFVSWEIYSSILPKDGSMDIGAHVCVCARLLSTSTFELQTWVVSEGHLST
jgi:hypothetical protein